MGKLTLIQPARIGDIIICLPIARYYAQQGKQVVWPVASSYFTMFSHAVNYVEFTPVSDDRNTWVKESLELAGDGEVLNLAFGLLPLNKAWFEWRASGIPFDMYKYALAKVPFLQKWDLSIQRDPAREAALFSRVNPGKPYLVYQQQASDTHADITWKQDEQSLEKIEITALTDNVFDWLHVMEKAEKLVLVDSCFVNLVEQLHIPVKKRRLRKMGYNLPHDYPVLRGDWEEK